MFIRVLSARPGAFFVEASEGASEDRKKMALTSGGSRRREAARGGAMERGDRGGVNGSGLRRFGKELTISDAFFVV
jgi:hypothetical protein